MLSPQAFITPQGSAAHRALMQAGCEPPAHLRRSAASAEALGGSCGGFGSVLVAGGAKSSAVPNPCQTRAKSMPPCTVLEQHGAARLGATGPDPAPQRSHEVK